MGFGTGAKVTLVMTDALFSYRIELELGESGILIYIWYHNTC